MTADNIVLLLNLVLAVIAIVSSIDVYRDTRKLRKNLSDQIQKELDDVSRD